MVVNDRPLVVLHKKVLSDEEVAHLLVLSSGRWIPSTVVDNGTGESVLHDHRTGQIACLDAALEKDPVVLAINERIANMTGTKPEQGEALQVVKYGVGEQYKPHYDWFDPSVPGPRLNLQKGGQRIRTALLYLKQATVGGQTDFPRLKLKLRPEPGDMLVFDNVDPLTMAPYQDAEHAGCPVEEGEKIVATRWIRERAADGSQEPPALSAKNEADRKLQEMKAVAVRAKNEAEQAVKRERDARETACTAEVNEVLARHRCRMQGVPVTEIDPRNGTLRIGATVEVFAND